jgi:AraC-like DNA-binding protein
MPAPTYKRYDAELIVLLEQQVLPWWERYGTTHLAASANTLKEFKAQKLPDQVTTSVKKRYGPTLSYRKTRTNPHASKHWPDDAQAASPYAKFCCVLKGCADLHIADYIVHCPQSHFLLLRPQIPFPSGMVPHLVGEHLEHRYCELLWFDSPPIFDKQIRLWTCHSEGDRHWAKPRFDFCFVEHQEVITFFHHFLREIQEQKPGWQAIAESSFLTFLRLFIRELKQGDFYYGGSLKAPEAPAPNTTPIAMALAYINSHLNQHLTIEVVAEAVYMSRASFVRRFREQTGQTFNQYLTERRLEVAQRFLREENWHIAQISQFVGLQPVQLRNLFRKHTGMSPSDYRSTFKD